MSDFLTNLLQRSLGSATLVEPMTPSRFAGSSGQVDTDDAGEGVNVENTQPHPIDAMQADQASGRTARHVAASLLRQYETEFVQRKGVTGPSSAEPQTVSPRDTISRVTVPHSVSPQPDAQNTFSPVAGETRSRAENIATQPPVIDAPPPEPLPWPSSTTEAVPAGESQNTEQARRPAVPGNRQGDPVMRPLPDNASPLTQILPEADREIPRGRHSPLTERGERHSQSVLPASPATPSAMPGREAIHGEDAMLPPRIEVTIGRIEVRAEVTPPAPSPRPQTRMPPLSLADYLQSRDGGGQ